MKTSVPRKRPLESEVDGDIGCSVKRHKIEEVNLF